MSNVYISYFMYFLFSDTFMCYYSPCAYTVSSPVQLIHHSVSHHNSPDKKFSIRQKLFDETSGQFGYKSVHFPVKIQEISTRLAKGEKVYLNVEARKISFKRALLEEGNVTNTSQSTYSDT